jgi:ATP-dependent helicase/nuclease subunit A
VPGRIQGEFDFDGAADAADDLDELLKLTGLEAPEFGTIVHSFIEAQFNNQSRRIPLHLAAALNNEKLLAAVETKANALADGFFNSALGRLALAAPYRETEFSVLTSAAGNSGMVTITGKIDLLFEAQGAIHVVDFKTDKVQEPQRHEGQLAVYQRAAADIFKQPVKCWLFYLRTAADVDLSGKISTSPEELVAIWEKEHT